MAGSWDAMVAIELQQIRGLADALREIAASTFDDDDGTGAWIRETPETVRETLTAAADALADFGAPIPDRF